MPRRKELFAAPLLILLAQPLFATIESRQATIGGGGENGRCSVQLTVDGSAEVEISGSAGSLRTISGQPAAWRSFHCSAPLPVNARDFGIARMSGRGSIQVVQDPRRSGGRAVIRIDDPQRGPGNYSFELQWSDHRGAWPPPRPGWSDDKPGRAIASCKDAVADRLNRDGYRYIAFDKTVPGSGYGDSDWITGDVSGRRGFDTRYFSFHCSVDFASARVRSVDVRNRWR